MGAGGGSFIMGCSCKFFLHSNWEPLIEHEFYVCLAQVVAAKL